MASWNTKEKNGLWKGGRSVASNGYVLIRVGKDHHLSDVRGYAYEHRLVAEKKAGRRLQKGEQVHHKNGIKTDNRPENIELMPSLAHHLKEHRRTGKRRRDPGEINTVIACGCGCGSMLALFDEFGRPRQFINGHNPPDRSVANLFIESCGLGTSIGDIRARTGQTISAVKAMASNLVNQKLIKRIKRGIYGKND